MQNYRRRVLDTNVKQTFPRPYALTFPTFFHLLPTFIFKNSSPTICSKLSYRRSYSSGRLHV